MKTIQNWKHDSDSYSNGQQNSVFPRIERMELMPT